MKTIFLSVLLLVASFAFSSNIYAQEEVEATYGSWRYGGYISAYGIDKTVAAEQGIDSGAISIGFVADYKKTNWVTSIGFDFIMYDDNNSFSQLVEGGGLFNNGDISNESSEASAGLFYAATGYEWRFSENRDIALLLQGGYGHIFSSERSISYCTNCYEESIDIDGGLFAKVMATKETDRFGFSIYAKQFLSGDGLSNSLGLMWSTKF